MDHLHQSVSQATAPSRYGHPPVRGPVQAGSAAAETAPSADAWFAGFLDAHRVPIRAEGRINNQSFEVFEEAPHAASSRRTPDDPFAETRPALQEPSHTETLRAQRLQPQAETVPDSSHEAGHVLPFTDQTASPTTVSNEIQPSTFDSSRHNSLPSQPGTSIPSAPYVPQQEPSVRSGSSHSRNEGHAAFRGATLPNQSAIEVQRGEGVSGLATGATRNNTTAGVSGVQGAGARDSGGMARQFGEMLGAKSSEAGNQRPIHHGTTIVRDRGAQPGERNAASESGAKTGTTHGERSLDELRSSQFARLVQFLRTGGGPKNSTARLMLMPPELGRIEVDVRLRGDEMRVRVVAESEEAVALLRDRLEELRASLARHGLRMGRAEVISEATRAREEERGGHSIFREPAELSTDPNGLGSASTGQDRAMPRSPGGLDRRGSRADGSGGTDDQQTHLEAVESGPPGYGALGRLDIRI